MFIAPVCAPAGDRVGAGQPGDQAVEPGGRSRTPPAARPRAGSSPRTRPCPRSSRRACRAISFSSGCICFTVAARLPGAGRSLHCGEYYLVKYATQRNVTAPTRRQTHRLEGNLGNDVLPSPAMTTQPGWEPRPGPTRGETARRAPRGAAGGWPDDPARRRRGPAGSRTARSARARPPRARSAQRTGLGRARRPGKRRPPAAARAEAAPGRRPVRGVRALAAALDRRHVDQERPAGAGRRRP